MLFFVSFASNAQKTTSALNAGLNLNCSKYLQMLSILEINREHDVVYILLRPELRDVPGSVARSVRVADDIVLDLDANEKLIGIELLNASCDQVGSTLRDVV